jgi:hypothetical protein
LKFFNLSLDLELLAQNLMRFGALTLLFAVMMVFSRLDGATHHQVRKKSSIRSELPQVKYWLILHPGDLSVVFVFCCNIGASFRL